MGISVRQGTKKPRARKADLGGHSAGRGRGYNSLDRDRKCLGPTDLVADREYKNSPGVKKFPSMDRGCIYAMMFLVALGFIPACHAPNSVTLSGNGPYYVGNDATFTCSSLSSDLPSSFIWRVNGIIVSNNNYSNVEIEHFSTRSHFVIKSLTARQDNTTVLCEATFPGGTIPSRTLTLHVHVGRRPVTTPQPPLGDITETTEGILSYVGNLTVDVLDTTMLNISWTPPPSLNISGPDILYYCVSLYRVISNATELIESHCNITEEEYLGIELPEGRDACGSTDIYFVSVTARNVVGNGTATNSSVDFGYDQGCAITDNSTADNVTDGVDGVTTTGVNYGMIAGVVAGVMILLYVLVPVVAFTSYHFLHSEDEALPSTNQSQGKQRPPRIKATVRTDEASVTQVDFDESPPIKDITSNQHEQLVPSVVSGKTSATKKVHAKREPPGLSCRRDCEIENHQVERLTMDDEPTAHNTRNEDVQCDEGGETTASVQDSNMPLHMTYCYR